jgi:fructuronate reductase
LNLCNEQLASIPNGRKPEYDRENTKVGIVHIGVGAFHRAHQAYYTEATLNRFGGDWRILGVSLRRPDMRDQLKAQEFLYSLVTRRDEEVDYQVIGALTNILVAPEDPEAVIDALSDAAIKVVTLTITEKGYGLNAASGQLDKQQPDIAHDLGSDSPPRTALGFIAKAMERRMQLKRKGLTLISCDNISNNGRKLERALLEFAEHHSVALAEWISRNCSFPNTMVDRIVPATSDKDVLQFAKECGLQDKAPVFTEPFSQWVIEKRFANDIPPWDKVGVQFVDDVEPFEALKLRTLNASHSLIAYLGCLLGKETVADAIGDIRIRGAVQGLMKEEAQPSLQIPVGFSIEQYQNDLLTRFSNKALNHRCSQIAMDGSQKIPQRFVPILIHQLSNRGSIRYTSLAIAAWLVFLRGDSGHRFEDPMAEELNTIWHDSNQDPVDALLSMRKIFPANLAIESSFRSALANYTNILAQGNFPESLAP